MDALSSQSLVTGYRAVLEAAVRYPRFFPLYMTAAGTIPPARVLVLGAGVAGLQAIGTAKRLGARVSANDIRAASAEEVASMGGTFINLDIDAAAERNAAATPVNSARTGRNASAASWPRMSRRRTSLITTAAIPGRAAPLLVTTAMVRRHAGRVGRRRPRRGVRRQHRRVDRRARTCRCRSTAASVTLVGLQDAASAMPSDASRLFARNVSNFARADDRQTARWPRTSTTTWSPERA